MTTIKAFAEGNLGEYLGTVARNLRDEVHREPDNKLLNVDTNQYVDYLVLKYEVEPLTVAWEQMTVDQAERQIPAELHNSYRYNVEPGRSYPRQVIIYRIPL